MAEKTDGPKDLFGDPWNPPRDPRGRKSHRPSAQVREMVGQLKGTGSSDEEIALQIGLSVPTLKKYYFRELEHGGTLARQALLKRLWDKAMEGNVSAAKVILAELPKAAAEEFDRLAKAPRTSAAVGKKEARQQAADQAGRGTEWEGDLDVGVPH